MMAYISDGTSRVVITAFELLKRDSVIGWDDILYVYMSKYENHQYMDFGMMDATFD